MKENIRVLILKERKYGSRLIKRDKQLPKMKLIKKVLFWFCRNVTLWIMEVHYLNKFTTNDNHHDFFRAKMATEYKCVYCIVNAKVKLHCYSLQKCTRFAIKRPILYTRQVKGSQPSTRIQYSFTNESNYKYKLTSRKKCVMNSDPIVWSKKGISL